MMVGGFEKSSHHHANSNPKWAVSQASEKVSYQPVSASVGMKTIEGEESEVARINVSIRPIKRQVDLGARDVSGGGRRGDLAIYRVQIRFQYLEVITLIVRPCVLRPVFIHIWIVDVHRADDSVP